MKLNTKRFLPFFIGLWAMVLCASFAPKTVPSFFYGIKTVCIDAGHGGKDPGCHGDVHKEKDVALAIALKLGALIEKNIKDVKVVYTRKTDVFVELGDRASIANKAKADLFICIHCNSACLRDKKLKKDICKPDVHGAETYVMGLHKTQANLDVAKRENSSILLEDNYKAKYDGFDPDSDEGYILMNLTQNAFLDHSIRFAARAQKHMKKLAGRNDKGVKQAGFLVLWKTAMPSVLIETGFLTNEEEHDFLGSDAGQDFMAVSIFRAFREYKDDIEGRAVGYNDQFENMTPFVPVKKVKPENTSLEKDSGQVGKKDEPKKDPEHEKGNTLPEKTVTSNSEVWFSVQFYSSDSKVDIAKSNFKNLPGIYEYEDKGMYKYTSGKFKKPEEAMNHQKSVREHGFKDAFVVAFKEGKRIPYGEALKLIKD
jgi:N-acetylmuramoyl-L-alanine amidase